MRFILTLQNPQPGKNVITLNYQYPLSAAIYKIIQRADETYATFLHDQGYQYGSKTFKFFTFSDFRTPFDITGDRMVMRTDTASLTICFHIPDAAENFIRGLFMDQQIEIADSRSKASFIVKQVIAEKMPANSPIEAILLHPISPVVVGRKNERGNYDYISPGEADFTELITDNLLAKYAADTEIDEDELKRLKNSIQTKTVFFSKPPRGRLLTIKEGTDAETKVRGYDKFRLHIEAPVPVIEMALNAGIGMHNAMGMGCVEIASN